MSALTSHIRVLRVEAAELIRVGREAHESAKNATACDEHSALVEFTAAMVLTRLAQAKFGAADRLDAEEQAAADKLKPSEGDVTYNPKGRSKA